MRLASLALLVASAACVFACDDGGAQAPTACTGGTRLCPDGSCQFTCPATGGGGAGSGVGGAAPIAGKGPVDPGPETNAECTDTSTTSGKFAVQYAGAHVAVTGQTKDYYLHTNWWYNGEQDTTGAYTGYDGQTVDYQGLSFTIGNPNGAAVADNDGMPMGYPSLYIGSYSGNGTQGSNLPIPVSNISKVPTVFSTNAADGDIANHNAAYDVWFTAGNTPLASNEYSPGIGGAYLMVWLFKPTNRQPRGSVAATDRAVTIPGVDGAWDVWVDHSDPACISYVATEPLNGLSFDLNAFIRESVDKKRGIDDTMSLSIVFAGFEVWGGGDGLKVKNFCANVVPKG